MDLDSKYAPQPEGGQKQFTQVWGSLTPANLNAIHQKKKVDALVVLFRRTLNAWWKASTIARAQTEKADACALRLSAEHGVHDLLVWLKFLLTAFDKFILASALN